MYKYTHVQIHNCTNTQIHSDSGQIGHADTKRRLNSPSALPGPSQLLDQMPPIIGPEIRPAVPPHTETPKMPDSGDPQNGQWPLNWDREGDRIGTEGHLGLTPHR